MTEMVWTVPGSELAFGLLKSKLKYPEWLMVFSVMVFSVSLISDPWFQTCVCGASHRLGFYAHIDTPGHPMMAGALALPNRPQLPVLILRVVSGVLCGGHSLMRRRQAFQSPVDNLEETQL